MCHHGNATKLARTYEEYRKCLIEAVPGIRSGPMDILLQTGRLYSNRYLNLSVNYVTRIVANDEKGATTTPRLISHPDSAVDSTIHPLLLASVTLSLPIRTRKWRNCAFVILFDVRSTRLVERSWISSGIRSTRKREKPEVERPSEPLYWQCGASPRGTLARELSTAIVTF